MIKSLSAFAVLALASTVTFGDAVEPGDMAGENTPGGQAGIAWAKAMFASCDNPQAVTKMFAKYVDIARYKNHPAARDGDEAKMESAVAAQMCTKHTQLDIKKVVVSGNLVILQMGVSNDDTPNPTGITEWFRIKDGKIVDHWDMSRKMQSAEDRVF
ncbi:MAG: hypothetical protein QM718_14720 [Steroidobacteraceae bacterium]